MDPKEAVIPDLLNREVEILRDILTPKVKRELGETKTELQDAKGNLSQASKGDQQGVPSHINFCSNHDPPSAEQVVQSLSLPSEQQYSKCTSLVPKNDSFK